MANQQSNDDAMTQNAPSLNLGGRDILKFCFTICDT
jgi:hypothetical protein